jgi:hypothetical protein
MQRPRGADCAVAGAVHEQFSTEDAFATGADIQGGDSFNGAVFLFLDNTLHEVTEEEGEGFFIAANLFLFVVGKVRRSALGR